MDNIGFLIAYTTQFPKMYRFANLPKMPTKLHSEPDYNVKSIKSKHVAGYSICILKNNARGYPATVTAVDIIDTMYVFIDLFISVRCF